MTNKDNKKEIDKISNLNIENKNLQDDKLIVFDNKNIRRTWFNNEWWYVATDIVLALTNSKDSKGYLKDMKRRNDGFNEGWGQFATPLSIDAEKRIGKKIINQNNYLDNKKQEGIE